MDNYGISSLQGFAYQIKVFVLKLADLGDEDSLGYEFLDDIGKFNSDNKEEIENSLQNATTKFNIGNDISVCQVKHTKMQKKDYERVFLNWIVMYEKCPNINKYELIVDETYGNKDIVKDLDLNELYNKINSSKGANLNLYVKVKNIIKKNYNLFVQIFNDIKSKYSFKQIKDIDANIYDKYKSLFHHGGVYDSTYIQRLEELINKIQTNILRSVNKRETYLCSYKQYKHIVDDICRGVTDQEYALNYSDFKKNSHIDLHNTSIVDSREYKQLLKCDLGESFIKENLIYEQYYRQFQIKKLENMRANEIDTLEGVTYRNFYLTKLKLMKNNDDSPFNRYRETTSSENSYAPNEQVRYGSAIFLTGDEISDDKQISWEDEDETTK